MATLKSWQAHVQKNNSKRKTWCGDTIPPFDFSLVSIDHAVACIETQASVLPCPACLREISAVIAKGNR